MTPIQSAGWRLQPGAPEADAVAPLADGGSLSVVFLSPRMARVSWKPAGGFQEPRTWAIAPTPGSDVPWAGRERSSLEGFQRPPLEVLRGAETGPGSGVGRGGTGPADSVEEPVPEAASGAASGAVSAAAAVPAALTDWAPAGAPVLASSELAVGLQAGTGQAVRLVWADRQTGQVVQADRGTSAYLSERRTGLRRHCLVRDPADRYYGLGDKTGPLNLHGRRLRCLGLDAIGYDPIQGDPLYKHWPFLLTRTPQGLWTGLYYDTLCATTFDLGCEHDNYHGLYRSADIDDGDLDVTLMIGRTPGEVVRQFVALIGGTLLPPRWTLGFAQTAMGLADAPDAQHLLEHFIDTCAQKRVPISAFHYGSGYSSRGKQRYVFTWNRSKFPEPERLNARFQAAGMRLVANLKPCLLDDHPAYATLAQQHAFIEHGQRGEPVVEPFWDGQGAHLDFTRPQTVAWWQQQLGEQIHQKGIDVGWNDNNEYAIQSEDAITAGTHPANHDGVTDGTHGAIHDGTTDGCTTDGRAAPLPIHRSRPLHALLMTRATFEAQQRRAQQLGDPGAVFTVTRAGPPGLQRYAQTWTGDNTTSWATLKWNIRTGLQMSLSGLFNTGHDVGGFYGPVPEPELFLRWVQACCLNPRMVMNSWKAGGVSNLPWMHPEVTGAVLDAIRLRYRLLPYLWQCFERASSHHEPIIRPTFFNWPDDAACLDDSDEFMLGEHLLVAPVVHAGERLRRLYLPRLPDGRCWVGWHARERLAAGQWHEVAAPLDRLPLFVTEGASLPVAAPRGDDLPRHDDPVSELLRF